MTSVAPGEVEKGNSPVDSLPSQPHSSNEKQAETCNTPVDDNSSTIRERSLVWKIDCHLLPILFVLYLFAFLDRVNLGNARIQGLMQDLHMDGSMYNIASEILFVPYILLDTPSNILIKRVRPSYYLSGLMFFWGIITVCEGVVSSYAGFIVCRILLGVFEAGVFPGCAYLISMYYKRFELQKRLVLFFTSTILAGAFGGFLAYAISHMAGLGGYNGWRWIFIIEGLVTVVVSVVGSFTIADWPDSARFLTDEEKAIVEARIASENADGAARMDTLDKAAVERIFGDWKILCGILMYVSAGTTGYATNFFMPTILTELGWVASQAQLYTIPVYMLSFIVTLFCAWWSDRIQHRYTFAVSGLAVASIGYIVLLCESSIPVGARYMALYLVNGGNYIALPLVVVWLANNMAGHYKRAFGTSLQIGFGNIAGIIGSNIFLTNEAPHYPTGYGTGFALILLCIVVCTVFRCGLKRENRRRERGERDYRLRLNDADNLGDDHPEFRYTS